MTFEELCDKVNATGYSSDRKMGTCPAHDDKQASLSIAQGEKGLLVYCHAGCDTADVMTALGEDTKSLFKMSKGGFAGEQYIYTDATGTPVIRVTRTVPKGFSQEHWNGEKWVAGARGIERPLYNLPEILKRKDEDVYWTEGEKDADLLSSLGYLATTVGGATAPWHDSYGETLAGRRVIVVADNDDPGRKAAESIRAALAGRSVSVNIVVAAEGKDFFDHYAAGFNVEELCGLVGQPTYSKYHYVDLEAQDDVEFEWLIEPILPKNAYVMFYGQSQAGKSMLSFAFASLLSHRGISTTYFSEEDNGLLVRRKRHKWDPDLNYFRASVQNGMDLADESWVEAICENEKGRDLIVIDTYSSVFFGEGDQNQKAIGFDRLVRRIIRETGATVVLIDHSGYDDSHMRDASAKQQKADVVMHVKETQPWMGVGTPASYKITNQKASRYENPFVYDLGIYDTVGGKCEVRWVGRGPNGWWNVESSSTPSQGVGRDGLTTPPLDSLNVGEGTDNTAEGTSESSVEQPVSQSTEAAPPMTYKEKRAERAALSRVKEMFDLA